jgi:hypothetical protein
MNALANMHFGVDVSDRGIFSADDLMQLQADEGGAWLITSSSSSSSGPACTVCTHTCNSNTLK